LAKHETIVHSSGFSDFELRIAPKTNFIKVPASNTNKTINMFSFMYQVPFESKFKNAEFNAVTFYSLKYLNCYNCVEFV
jgi:hypothetical protein